MNAIVLVITIVAIVALAGIAILLALQNMASAFENLYMTAMVLSLANLIFIAVQAFRGSFVVLDVVLAIISGLISVFCILYGFWGITEGAEAAMAAQETLEEQKAERGTAGPMAGGTT